MVLMHVSYLPRVRFGVNIFVQRLFVPDALFAGAAFFVSDRQAHYLGTVMRMGAGECLKLFNGRDGEWVARLVGIKRHQAQLEVATQARPQQPEPDIWLVFAPLKRDFTDFVIQKATELGVSAILPVFTERTNAARINADRLAAIAIEAAEQSERLSVPEIHAPVKFLDFLASWPEGRGLAAAIERGAAVPIPQQAGGLLVGPEGGFAPAELDALRAARFVSPICLGPRILRAETAVVAGLALLQGAAWSTNSVRF
jgi:16S rRNA (uracil1498-N3)-methyltransferase